jgi:NAD(P)-dependent dehydrogenase (short-subunit alcohol dehydrogenase family)
LANQRKRKGQTQAKLDKRIGISTSQIAAVQAAGSDAFAIEGDFTKGTVVEAVFTEGKRRFGGIDIAVNTIGKVLKKPIVDTSEQEYDDMMAVNAKTAYLFLREAGKQLNDNGRVVTIVTSLLAAFTGLYSTYAGGKAPVEHFTRAAAKEFGTRGISVNSVGPGPMDTPFFYPAETPDSIAYHKLFLRWVTYSTSWRLAFTLAFVHP